MRFLYIIGALFLLFACTSKSKTEGKAGGNPRMEVLGAKYDFGRISAGDTVRHDYTIRNVGDGNLVVYEVRPSCGCIAVNDSLRIVAPGDSTLIEVLYISAYKHGVQQKSVVLHTNDTLSRRYRLWISGFVE